MTYAELAKIQSRIIYLNQHVPNEQAGLTFQMIRLCKKTVDIEHDLIRSYYIKDISLSEYNLRDAKIKARYTEEVKILEGQQAILDLQNTELKRLLKEYNEEIEKFDFSEDEAVVPLKDGERQEMKPIEKLEPLKMNPSIVSPWNLLPETSNVDNSELNV